MGSRLLGNALILKQERHPPRHLDIRLFPKKFKMIYTKGETVKHIVFIFYSSFFFEHLMFWDGSAEIRSSDLAALKSFTTDFNNRFEKKHLCLYEMKLMFSALCFVCHGLLHQSFCSQIALGDKFSISIYIKDLKHCIGLVVSKGHETKHRDLEVSRR